MSEILNQELPYRPWDSGHSKLPGTQLWKDEMFFQPSDAFEAQKNYRLELWQKIGSEIFAEQKTSLPAQNEVLELVTHEHGAVEIDAPPLVRAGLSQQDDLCILNPENDFELEAGFVAFPAGWSIRQKLGRNMASIHSPVNYYSEELNQRVVRMMGFLRQGVPLWRTNFHLWPTAELCQIRDENNPRPYSEEGQFLRSERQIFVRLPKSNRVLFIIRTYVLDLNIHSELAEQMRRAKLP